MPEPQVAASMTTCSSLLPGEVSALDVRIELGMSDAEFSAICQRVVGRPGLRTADEDRRVRATMRGAKP